MEIEWLSDVADWLDCPSVDEAQTLGFTYMRLGGE
jgi:hypothetical protein